MNQVEEMIERISDTIEKKGGSPDREKVASKLNLLLSEFHIPADEAERMVLQELLKELKIAGGASSARETETRNIGDLIPGEWVAVEGRIVSLQVPPTEAIAQKGVIADDSGAIGFVIWAKAGAPLLEDCRWYRFESAVVDEYRSAPNLKIHSGTTVTPMEEDRPILPSMTPVSELRPGISSVRAKVVQDWDVRHERMLQTGLLGDETGTVKFIIWKGEEKEKLEEGKVYTIYYASADEYAGRISVDLTGAMYIEEEGADIDVSRGSAEITGAFVHMGTGSGLIKRCTVEGCNRALSRQNYCPVHEIQSTFRYDLRITGVVDDGIRAANVLMQRESAEKLSGVTLEEAIATAENNPLGFDDVFIRIRDAVLGRYVRCRGGDIDGTLLVQDIETLPFDEGRHAALINRSAEVQGGAEE